MVFMSERYIMQSIFSSAARPQESGETGVRFRGRDGELKMNWTKPGRFGRTIALWALNRIDLFCFG